MIRIELRRQRRPVLLAATMAVGLSSCGASAIESLTSSSSLPESTALTTSSPTPSTLSATIPTLPDRTVADIAAVFSGRYSVGAQNVWVVQIPSDTVAEMVGDPLPGVAPVEQITFAYSTGNLVDEGAHPPPGVEVTVSGRMAYVIAGSNGDLLGGGLLKGDPSVDAPWTDHAVRLSTLLSN